MDKSGLASCDKLLRIMGDDLSLSDDIFSITLECADISSNE